MPKYIDAEKLIEKIDEAQEELKSDNDAILEIRKKTYKALCVLRGMIDNIPAADVIPRTEIEKIFAEIESVIGEQYENYVFDNRDIEGIEQDAIIAFADTMQKHFAELEKKYTGAQE